MNWEIVGAIAELLGALGVILSLLYLAIQVRHSRQATNSATYQTIQSNLATTARLLSENEEIALMYNAAIDGKPLNNLDTTRLRTLFEELTYQFEDLLFLHESGNLQTDLFMNQIYNGLGMFKTELYLEVLKNRKGALSGRYREFIMHLISEGALDEV
jgi:hypothetical protein